MDQSQSWAQLREEDDCSLMRYLTAGNHDALAVIVDRYQRLVLSVALRIVRNVNEAEDVVQSVFLDIFRKAGQFDPSRGTLKVWLLQYAYTRSINRRHYLEQRQFYTALEIGDVPPISLVAEPRNSKRLAPVETVRLVRQALAALSDRQQTAITLIYFEGLTLAEAAQKTGEGLSAVRHNYYRGLMKLREIINSSRVGDGDAVRSDSSRECVSLEAANLKPRTI
jgi:RNA polymerase sigma-70 factor (ECF subfamily)